MARQLADYDHVHRFGDRSRGFLQVLLPEIVLTRGHGGLTVDIAIDDDLLCIKDNDGKGDVHAFLEGSGAGRQALADGLRRFLDDPDLLSYRLDAAAAPLRFANAGVLPVVRLDGEDYLCLFYRDIFPVGWNIANGASDNERELLEPATVILREFTEELFIADKSARLLYRFDGADTPETRGAFDKSLAAWQGRAEGKDLQDHEVGPIPVKWIEGPDRVRVRLHDRQHTTAGCFVSITPEDGAVELDRIAMLNLRGDISLFDGELLDGKPINRVVGLFRLADLSGRLAGDDVRPDRIFFGGQERPVGDLESIIRNEYLVGEAFGGNGNDRIARYDAVQGPRFDLCPITRAVSGRFFRWEEEQRQARSRTFAVRPEPRPAPAPGPAPVFISFKSQDVAIGRWLYEALADLGIEAFFSEESLVNLGESDYARAIDRALEHARCMVVVGTDAAHFDSDWVGYEWRSFLNEVRAGRTQGEIFTFSHRVAMEEMPYALRRFQNVPYVPSSPQDSLANMCRHVQAALPISPA